MRRWFLFESVTPSLLTELASSSVALACAWLRPPAQLLLAVTDGRGGNKLPAFSPAKCNVSGPARNSAVNRLFSC